MEEETLLGVDGKKFCKGKPELIEEEEGVDDHPGWRWPPLPIVQIAAAYEAMDEAKGGGGGYSPHHLKSSKKGSSESNGG